MPIYELCWEEHHSRQVQADSLEAARTWWRDALPEELGATVVEFYDLVVNELSDVSASERHVQPAPRDASAARPKPIITFDPDDLVSPTDVFRKVTLANGRRWGLHIYEIVVPEGQTAGMTEQEIGACVVELMRLMPKWRKEQMRESARLEREE